MAGYAAGKRALGVCDRCGFVYKLKKLRDEIYDMRKNGLKVCPTCLDEDQPQLQVGRYPVHDYESLRDPRPDRNTHGSSRAVREPVYSITGRGRVGVVTVEIT